MFRLLRNLILLIIVVVLIGGGALLAISYKSVLDNAAGAHGDLGAPGARFSRFTLDQQHHLALVWKLRFAKPSTRAPSVAVWRTSPFGEVKLEGSKK